MAASKVDLRPGVCSLTMSTIRPSTWRAKTAGTLRETFANAMWRIDTFGAVISSYAYNDFGQGTVEEKFHKLLSTDSASGLRQGLKLLHEKTPQP